MKCKLFLCAVVLGTLVLGAANLGGYQDGVKVVKKKSEPVHADEDLAKLAKATLKAARDVLDHKEDLGLVSEAHYIWSMRILAAECDVATDKEARVAAYKAHLDRMVEKERKYREAQKLIGGAAPHLRVAVFFRAQAELRWAQAKAGKLLNQH